MFHGKKNSGKGSRNKKGYIAPDQTRAVVRDEDLRIPPSLRDQLATSFTLRFLTTGNWAGSYTMTYQNLLDAWFVAGTATTAYQLFDFVKIRKVTVRAMAGPYSATSAIMPTANVGVEFPGLVGGQFGSGKQRVGTGVGYDTPAYVSLAPDRMSQTAQYQPSTANEAFIVRATDGLRTPVYGAVIDVQVSYKNSGDIAPAALGTARAGLTSGQLYFGGIDGLATANTVAKSAFIPFA
jgi:hypothetical protein